jgi:hypothetical protein
MRLPIKTPSKIIQLRDYIYMRAATATVTNESFRRAQKLLFKGEKNQRDQEIISFKHAHISMLHFIYKAKLT